MHTYCIAELASCHDGDLTRAKRLIDCAAQAGFDAVKLQFYSDAERLADRRHVAACTGCDNPTCYRCIYRRYQIPASWVPYLAGYCEKRWQGRVDFLCTVYLEQDIATVEPYVNRFKIASFEAADEVFLEAHRAYGKPRIVSTGMMDSERVRALYGHGDHLLLCTSSYPTPVDQLNLAAIRRLQLDGFSDHSARVDAGALAVMAGARILEVHIRDWDTSLKNPDYAVALNPAQFVQYVSYARLASVMLGDGFKRVMPCEAAMLPYRVTA